MSSWFEQARERLGKEYQQVTGTPKLPKRRKAALHRIGGGRWFDRWAPQCCHSTRLGAREKCMYLQGKTREEWMEEDWT